jgi:hypothetical protein
MVLLPDSFFHALAVVCARFLPDPHFAGLGYMAQVLVYDKENNTVASPLYTSGWKYSDWDDNY